MSELDFTAQRDRALERDNYECQSCGKDVGELIDPEKDTAHVHHKTPRQEGGTHELENLVTLCVDCHDEQHEHGIGEKSYPPDRRSTNTARGRALLTETEREQIAGDHGKQRKYEAVSRVRARISDELERDVELLEENHEDLLQELKEAVCGE